MKKFYKIIVSLVSAMTILSTPLHTLAYNSDYQIKGVPDVINGEEYNFAIGTLWSPTMDKLPDDNRTNKVIIWSLYQGEDPYIMEERDDGSKKKADNPHYTWYKGGWNTRRLGVKVRNAKFEYEDGKLTDADNLEINIDYSPGGTEVLYNSENSDGDHFKFLLDNLKNTGNNDNPTLYQNVYYVEDGEYLFTRLSSKDVNQPKGSHSDPVDNIQSYVVVPTDKLVSPFIEDGFNEEALENEWVNLDGGKTVTVYAMFGSADWCYDNLNAYRDWIAAKEGDVNPYDDYSEPEEEIEEEIIEEEEEIDPDDVPISKPVIVEQPVEEVDKTDSLAKLIVLSAVAVVLIVVGFIAYKKWKKKNDEYL